MARFRFSSVVVLALCAACAPETRMLAYPDGARYEEAQWRGPMRDGWRRNHYPDGTLQREVAYERGEPAGVWSFYAEDGTLLSRGEYRNGRRAGTWIENHPNGRPSSRGDYRDGERDGTWSRFDLEGVLTYEETWDRGTLLGTRSLTAR